MARLPPLNALRCFEAAARHQSFSKAALELHVTQSAISHQIRLIEDWFGMSLFSRQGRQTIPTGHGREFAEAVEDAFKIVQDAAVRLKASEANPTLTIASIPSIATIWLIPRLEGFFKAHPEFPVKVVYSIYGQAIDFTDVDICITWGVKASDEHRHTLLFPGASVAVGHPGLVERAGPFDTPEALLTAPLLHDTNRADWQTFMRLAGIRNAPQSPGPLFEDFNFLRAAALAGQGLALCPKSVVQSDIDAGRLVELYKGIAVKEDYGYWLVEPNDGKASPAREAFKKWLMNKAQATLELG
jgi:LysR family transcriptional regulator, glycine cleavage system transcriptional activator